MNQEKIAIVLTTYNPNHEYFIKQIDSIRAQTWQNWVCYIVDDKSAQEYQTFIQKVVEGDSRFICYFHDTNLGSYHNFERGLNYCLKDPAIASIAFSDQDDIWHQEKLKLLVEKMRADNAVLVHSDLTVVNDKEEIIHQSCWEYEGRNPEGTNFGVLLLKNTITGCSMLFCASILPKVLPFPVQKEIVWHHDNWVALVASKLGKLSHLRTPLIFYRQHANNSTLGAKKKSSSLLYQFNSWKKKGFNIGGNSYLNQKRLSDAIHSRLSLKNNPFDNAKFDFGLRVLSLGYQCYQSGNEATGIALRYTVLKVLFDFRKIFKK